MSRLADALKRRFASPEAALRHLGLDTSLLNGETNMITSAAALAAVRALKRRGLIAQDSNEEEGARVLQQEGDRTMRRPRMGDAEMQERAREEQCRDAMRRASDAADPLDEEDMKDVLEAIAENYPQVLASVQHEMAADNRGPKGWARDRAERRSAEDSLRAKDAMRARKFGLTGRDAPAPFEGMPEPGGRIYHDRDEHPSKREELGAIDRRRAHDLALDGGSTLDAFANWLPGAASINKV